VSASPETASGTSGAQESAAALEVRSRSRTSSSGFVRRGWLVRRLLLVADLAGLSLAFVLAQILVVELRDGLGGTVALRTELMLFVLALPCWILAAKLSGLYDRDCERNDHSTFDDAATVFHLLTGVAWLLVVVGWVTKVAHPDFLTLFLFWALALGLVVVGRVAARALARRTAAYRQNTLIVGAGELGVLLARKIRNHPEYGLDLVGFVESGAHESAASPTALLGPTEALGELIAEHDVERVIVAFPGASREETLELLRTLHNEDVEVDLVPSLHEVVFPEATIHAIEGLSLLGLPRFRLPRSSALIKRIVDVLAASLALLVLLPLLAAVALLIRADSPGPVLFRQLRIGRLGAPFAIYKFRTMISDAEHRKAETAHLNMHAAGDPCMFKIPGDPRVTRVGRVLRRYSIDELPQLFNVIKGEMSLVGPRPLIPAEAQHVKQWAQRRLELRPGITGLWQVLGRSDIPFHEMTLLDYRYVSTWSLSNDLRLLAHTLPAVLRKRGAY
jgi:exopolysaccharide biosynthesis polyprenyl glycosylphosphotransferase